LHFDFFPAVVVLYGAANNELLFYDVLIIFYLTAVVAAIKFGGRSRAGATESSRCKY
jgi:hypothetical protein